MQDALDVKTMEHLLCWCDNYSAKIWKPAGSSMTLAISGHTRDYMPNIVLTPLEIISAGLIFIFFISRMLPHGKY
jgi:hypothetical protein